MLTTAFGRGCCRCFRRGLQRPRRGGTALCHLLHLLKLVTNLDLLVRQLLPTKIRNYFLSDFPFAFLLHRSCLAILHRDIHEHVHCLCTAAIPVAFAVFLRTRALLRAVAVSFLIPRWSAGIIGHRDRSFGGMSAFADAMSFLACFTSKRTSTNAICGCLRVFLCLRFLHSSTLHFVTRGFWTRRLGRCVWRHIAARREAFFSHLSIRPPKDHKISSIQRGSKVSMSEQVFSLSYWKSLKCRQAAMGLRRVL